jgi:serine/threonine protein kinase
MLTILYCCRHVRRKKFAYKRLGLGSSNGGGESETELTDHSPNDQDYGQARTVDGPIDWAQLLRDEHQVEDCNQVLLSLREIPRSCIRIISELGKGAFGVVYKALLKEDPRRPAYLVAVKSLHAGSSESERRELLVEAAVLGQFDHPHVIQLAGVVTIGQPLLMLVEYAEHGSLQSLLQGKQAFNTEQLAIWAGDVAEGLAYVHSRKFLHRDIASRNILVGSEWHCKLSDFGMAREAKVHTTYYRAKGGQVAVRWTAPEALDSRKFTRATDVWSYGILLYEMWTQARTPYELWNNQRVWVEVTSGFTLSPPEQCPREIAQLMVRCFETAEGRPGMAELATELRKLCAAGCFSQTETDVVGQESLDGSRSGGGGRRKSAASIGGSALASSAKGMDASQSSSVGSYLPTDGGRATRRRPSTYEYEHMEDDDVEMAAFS